LLTQCDQLHVGIITYIEQIVNRLNTNEVRLGKSYTMSSYNIILKIINENLKQHYKVNKLKCKQLIIFTESNIVIERILKLLLFIFLLSHCAVTMFSDNIY